MSILSRKLRTQKNWRGQLPIHHMRRFLSLSRRNFMAALSTGAAGLALSGCSLRKRSTSARSQQVLAQFGYGDVEFAGGAHEKQLEETRGVLMGLSEDSLLKPLRQMKGQPAPGEDMGGWYHYNPDYVWGKDRDGFAPGCHFGQWVSALARMYAIHPSSERSE